MLSKCIIDCYHEKNDLRKTWRGWMNLEGHVMVFMNFDNKMILLSVFSQSLQLSGIKLTFKDDRFIVMVFMVKLISENEFYSKFSMD